MANAALPYADTTAAAIEYLNDLKSSDSTVTRISAVILLEEQFGLYHIEADAVWKAWNSQRKGA